MITREKVGLAVLASITGVVAMLLASPPADADALTYVQALNDRGIAVYDTGMAINTGWAICGALEQVNAVVVVENLYQITGSDVPDREAAAAWVVSAAEQLCPWTDHRFPVVVR